MSDARYPHQPGWKTNNPETSRNAAKAMRPRAPNLRARCLAAYDAGHQLTADECAAHLGLSILSVRPRITELIKTGFLEDSGLRRPNDSEALATVWRRKPVQPTQTTMQL